MQQLSQSNPMTLKVGNLDQSITSVTCLWRLDERIGSSSAQTNIPLDDALKSSSFLIVYKGSVDFEIWFHTEVPAHSIRIPGIDVDWPLVLSARRGTHPITLFVVENREPKCYDARILHCLNSEHFIKTTPPHQAMEDDDRLHNRK